MFQLVDAVLQSRPWRRTLLVITYDEHGGFFDNVQPPKAVDDRPAMRKYGPRVPALHKRAAYQALLDESLKWHEEMALDGVQQPGEGLAIPHELTDFQKDFLGAEADLLAARRQLDAAGKAVF